MRINLDTAKLAKQKGYNEIVGAFYEELGENIIPHSGMNANWNEYPTGFSAPYQYELQKWLRDTHKIIVTVSYDAYLGYYWDVVNVLKQEEFQGEVELTARSYEATLELGLIEGLKLI